MRRFGLTALSVGLLVCAALLLLAHAPPAYSQTTEGLTLSGRLVDGQGQAIVAGEILVFLNEQPEPALTAESQEDGSWFAVLPEQPIETLALEIERAHYENYHTTLATDELLLLFADGAYSFGEIQLENRISGGFWVAGLTFIAVLLLIALEKLRNALAALAGISFVFIMSFVGAAIFPDLYVFNFERALSYINWEVIFLVMGMMIVVGIIEGTGIFQWLAFTAYRISRGRISLLIVVLIVITSVASALLDNVTTMLLMAPISIQIALALNISPLALLIPEILASNVSGISTLIGTPPNWSSRWSGG